MVVRTVAPAHRAPASAHAAVLQSQSTATMREGMMQVCCWHCYWFSQVLGSVAVYMPRCNQVQQVTLGIWVGSRCGRSVIRSALTIVLFSHITVGLTML